MSEERVWIIEAKKYTRENVEELVKSLKAQGFNVEKREIIFEYDDQF